MQQSKFLIFSLLLVLAVNGQLSGKQQNNPVVVDTNAVDTEVIATEAMNSEPLKAEIKQESFENPLLTEDEQHSQLLISSYDPDHVLYPVKIISIDNWLLTDDITEKDLRLAAGEHQILVVPDFSNIQPQIIFMSSPWPEKRISFSILSQQQIAVTARLMDKHELQWQVQMYRVELPESELINHSAEIRN